MGLFENFPYTDMYRADLDWIIRKLKEFQANMDEYEKQYGNLENYIHEEVYSYLGDDPNLMAAINEALARYGVTVEGLEDAIDALEADIESLSVNRHISNSFQIWVNNGAAMVYPTGGYNSDAWAGESIAAGNDTTGDGTRLKPFKTLARAMEAFDQYGNGCTICLYGGSSSASARTYNWDWYQIQCVQIHFMFVGKYVRLNIEGGSAQNERVYNSYIHIEGHDETQTGVVNITNSGATSGKQMYLEPGAWYFHDLTINGSANGHYQRMVTRGVVSYNHCVLNIATAVSNGFGNYTDCTFRTFDGPAGTGMVYGYAGSTILMGDSEFYNDGSYPSCVLMNNSVLHLIGTCTYHYTGTGTDDTPILAGTNNQIGCRSNDQIASWTRMDTSNYCTMTRTKLYATQNQLLLSSPSYQTAYGPYPVTLYSDIKFLVRVRYGTIERNAFISLSSFSPAAEWGTANGRVLLTTPMVTSYAANKFAAYYLQVYVTGQGKINIQYGHKVELDTGTHTNDSTGTGIPELEILGIYADA